MEDTLRKNLIYDFTGPYLLKGSGIFIRCIMPKI